MTAARRAMVATMNEDLCKTCGERMEFFGSLMEGKLECPHCRQVEFISEGVEVCRLREEETGDDYGN